LGDEEDSGTDALVIFPSTVKNFSARIAVSAMS
jgi:hypothetical protein